MRDSGRDASPPRAAEWMLARLAHRADRDAVLGDLAEEYELRSRGGESHAAATLWYCGQVLRSVLPVIERRLRGSRTDARHRRGDGLMRSLWQDLRYAARASMRHGAYAALTIGTLALGVAATTIVYSVVDGIVLNPFPYPEPERLIGVGPEFPRTGQALAFWEVLSPAEYRDIAAQSRALTDIVAWDMGNRTIAGADQPERVFTAMWWGNAFRTLGVAPALGRGFLAEELERDAKVVILSHRLWSRRFGGDSSIVGTGLAINGTPYTVVGVMPPRTLIYGTDLWIPMGVDPSLFPRNRRQFQVLARLAPGATLEQANAELATIAGRIEQEHGSRYGEYAGWRLVGATWTDINVRLLRPAAFLLLGAVGFVLLLVCANVASLTLARGAARRREMAVRTALGAGRRRLVRQLLTESLVLSLVGGAIGVLLALWGIQGFGALMAALPIPVPGDATLNGRVLAVAVFVSVLAGMLAGLLPALHASRTQIATTLRTESATATSGSSRHRLQRALVGAEVALALVLLAGGGLLIHSFVRLQRVDAGFDTGNVLTMRLTLPLERYAGAAIGGFFETLGQRLSTLPGVRGVAYGSQFPPGVFERRPVMIEGRPRARAEEIPTSYLTLASHGYFETLGIPLVRGRLFEERDREGAVPVAVINEVAASRFFPGEDPIGKRFRFREDAPAIEIVGIVGATRNRGLDRRAEPEMFGSARQWPGANNQLFLIVRTTGAPRELLPTVRAEVASLDPQQPIYAVQTVEQAFAAATAPRRIATAALTTFAAFALLLAAIGIYGVVSQSVAERTHEIGVRLALGARGRQVLAMIVRQSMWPVAIGAGVGLLGALAMGRLMTGLLYEISGTDPLTIAAVSVALALVALLASWLPARRASRLDPQLALRGE